MLQKELRRQTCQSWLLLRYARHCCRLLSGMSVGRRLTSLCWERRWRAMASFLRLRHTAHLNVIVIAHEMGVKALWLHPDMHDAPLPGSYHHIFASHPQCTRSSHSCQALSGRESLRAQPQGALH